MKRLLMRAFGRPEGVLGKLGGIIMAGMNQKVAARAVELLDFQPNDRVPEIGFGSASRRQSVVGPRRRC